MTSHVSVDQLVNAVATAVRESMSRIESHPGLSPSHASSPVVTPVSSRPTPYQRASSMQLVSSNTRRFEPPTIFRSTKRGKKNVGTPRSISYVRDIMCLPLRSKSSDGKVIIPRGSRRAFLAENGLIGKIQFTSIMSSQEIEEEICQVFSSPMGLSATDIADGQRFPFSYLQRTGAGSRSLCMPSVSSTFKWNGREVASLAKSGGFIYILAC